MRITNNYIYNTAEDNIAVGYSRVANLQNEISTGIRVDEASVDPIGMSQITLLQTQLDAMRQGEQSATTAQTELQIEQTQLNSLSSVIQSLITTTQKLANGTTSSQDMQNEAAQISQYLEEIITIANTKNPGGNSIFAGTNVSQDAYSITKDAQGNVTAVTYQGNDNQQQISLNSGVSVNIYQSGNTVFGSGANSIFSNMISLITQLKAGTFTATQATTELTQLTAFQTTTTNNLTTTQNQYGMADFEVNIFTSLKQNYTAMLGSIRDADYSKTVTQLSQQTTMLKATMAASLQLEKLNLFNQG